MTPFIVCAIALYMFVKCLWYKQWLPALSIVVLISFYIAYVGYTYTLPIDHYL